MNEKKEKRQAATMWLLTVLIVVLISIIVGLFIKVAKVKKQESAILGQQISQMKQKLDK